MHTTRRHQQLDLLLAGPSIITRPDHAAQDIPAFWQRFASEGWPQRLQEVAIDTDLYAVYHDYHGDHSGPYSMTIGVLMKADGRPPEGARCVRVPHGDVVVFQAEGQAAAAIWGTWAHINGPWQDRGHRRYLADMERFNAAARSALGRGEPVSVEIIVGVQ